MTQGFVDSGHFEPIFAIELDRDAARTYGANFGDEHIIQESIEKVRSIPRADVLIGGPPCQGFSPLNRKAVGFERRGLWREYLRALKMVEPAAFIMENVPELLRSSEYGEFKELAEDLGYAIEEDVLNAADFGVPQRRLRAIVIGVLHGSVPWPAATHDEDSWVTFREAVAGLSEKPTGLNWHRKRSPRPESILRYRAVPVNGGNRFQMQEKLDREGRGHLVPRCWREKPSGTTDVFGRLWWDRPAVTIRTEFHKPEKGRYLHPKAHRPITLREAARCMSFEDSFVFPEDQSMTSVARQIGNAVPPLLAHRVADALASELSQDGIRRPHRTVRATRHTARKGRGRRVVPSYA
jgi:DNA (cytosine-5)-methyltransferase 1